MAKPIGRNVKKKKDDEAQQQWIGVKNPARQCKKCLWAFPDTEYTIGAEKGNCEMYQPPDTKAPGILADEVDCEYFEEKE